MSRIAYVNGRYRALRDACVNIEDRGYQFADGVTGERFVGKFWDDSLPIAGAAARCREEPVLLAPTN